MTRAQLEHIIRAAAGIAQSDVIIVIGSQSILGAVPDAPASLTVSMEADVYPRDNPSAWNVIDGAIGEGSPFHETFGYYAQGVGPETATLAPGWQDRLVEIKNENTRGASGLCLSPLDLAVSKCVANREKDRDFVRELLRLKLVEPVALLSAVEALALSAEEKARINAFVRAHQA